MLGIILIVLSIYIVTIIYRIAQTTYKRKKLKVGDICSFYIGEIRFKAFVLSVSNEIEVKVLNRVIQIPRKLIFA
jgi:hypothetical protein